MDAGSVTSATRRMRPPQPVQVNTSIEKQRFSSSAQGRYREPATFFGSGDSPAMGAGATVGFGTMRARSLLAGARTPA